MNYYFYKIKKVIKPFSDYLKKIAEGENRHRTNIFLSLAITIFTLVLAGVSIWQILVFKDTVKIENRAYLVVDEIIPDTLVDGKPLTARVRINNTGKTPAYKVDHNFGFKIGKPFTTTDQIDKIVGEMSTPHDIRNVLGSGKSFDFFFDTKNFPFVLWKGLAFKIYTDSSILYLLGDVTYVDKFGERHFVNYAFQFDPKTRDFFQLSYHNDAD